MSLEPLPWDLRALLPGHEVWTVPVLLEVIRPESRSILIAARRTGMNNDSSNPTGVRSPAGLETRTGRSYQVEEDGTVTTTQGLATIERVDIRGVWSNEASDSVASLEWERLDDRRACRISAVRPGSIDEHREALDMLNRRTDDESEFFGVVVEVWKIDDSRPAPHFRIVSAPNDWRKQSISNRRQANVSEKGEQYRQFWQPLLERLNREDGSNKCSARGWPT